MSKEDSLRLLIKRQLEVSTGDKFYKPANVEKEVTQKIT